MKLSLIFDGSALSASNLQQAVAAAGTQTTIRVNTAQAIHINTLLAVLSAAGNTKTFSADFNGAQLTANNLQQAVTAAGTKTAISVNTAQAVNISTLLAILSSAGDTKNFSANFNGAQLTANNLQQAVTAAGARTAISVNTAQAIHINTLLAVLSAAGNTKTFSADFNGAQLTANNLQQAVTAAGTKTAISVNTAQAVNISTLLAILSSAGDTKNFSANFNGAQLTANNLQQAVTAAGARTAISVNTAQAIHINTLLAVLSAAGNTKTFSADFNGAQLTANNLQQAVTAAGAKTAINVNTAQAVNISTLLAILSSAGDTKNFSANFNGAQLTANNLQQAVAAAGNNTTIVVNSAQSVPINVLLELINIVG